MPTHDESGDRGPGSGGPVSAQDLADAAAAMAGAGRTDHVVLMFECEGTPDVTWTVASGTYSETLNDPYTLRLNLATDDTAAEPGRLLGRSCRFVLRRGSSFRQVTGIVSEVQEGSTHAQEVTTTNVVVDPAFEVLRHRVDTRIFQDLTAAQVLEAVLTEGLGAFQRTIDLRLRRTYPVCEYRTQYSESDLAFCERLMEEEGIVYWFEFADEAAETLVLSDDPLNFGPVESFHDIFPSGTLSYSEYEGGVGGHEYVSSFHVRSQLRPTRVVTRHFDWTHPAMMYEADSSAAEPEAGDPPGGARVAPEREVYQHDDRPLTFHEYGGLVYGAHDMNAQVRLRREAQAFDARVAEGSSTVTGLTVGRTFDLLGHPQGDLDGSYLVLGVSHYFDSSGVGYGNSFQCIPADTPYRPKRVTPKPRVPNIQTATVVGPRGEEIHTDEHGRVKVQLHWDRLGQRDEHSSCWVRVMQPWAGSGWGFVFIPRIGMEVMVCFVNGDPDLPMVIGSVYNGDNAPPYPLPADKTRSTIKTNSSLGGGGSNELRFEDKKGREEVYVHAEKDFNEVVEHDHSTLVHHDQRNEVDHVQTELIHVDQLLTVDQHRTKTIKGNERTDVQGTRTERVTGDEAITLMANRNLSIAGEFTETTTGNHSLTVESNQTISIQGAMSEQVGTTINVKAGDSITLETGDSSLKLEKDGTIVLKGKSILVNGKSLVQLKAAKIEEN